MLVIIIELLTSLKKPQISKWNIIFELNVTNKLLEKVPVFCSALLTGEGIWSLEFVFGNTLAAFLRLPVRCCVQQNCNWRLAQHALICDWCDRSYWLVARASNVQLISHRRDFCSVASRNIPCRCWRNMTLECSHWLLSEGFVLSFYYGKWWNIFCHMDEKCYRVHKSFHN
jgi:hypothetical protein